MDQMMVRVSMSCYDAKLGIIIGNSKLFIRASGTGGCFLTILFVSSRVHLLNQPNLTPELTYA